MRRPRTLAPALRPRAAALVAVVACLAGGIPQGAALAEPTSPANFAAAQRHADKARALYAQGAYREALVEYEAAHSLDPNAHDLIYNLGVVNEKLADIDQALKWIRLFLTMDLTAKERDKGETYARRLEGAKKEFDDRQAQQQASASATASSSSATPPPPASSPVEQPPPAPRGRVDALTITAAAISVAGFGFGAFMGIRAKADQPPPNSTTGPNEPYQDLVNRASNAHREAVFADVGFGVGLVGAAAAAYLYFARPKVAPAATTGSTTVSALPLTGGGALLVRGTF